MGTKDKAIAQAVKALRDSADNLEDGRDWLKSTKVRQNFIEQGISISEATVELAGPGFKVSVCIDPFSEWRG